MLRAASKIVAPAFALPVRIGVNRGHVFAGDIGTEFRRTFTVMGDTVNLAARLMAAAEPGTVYATAADSRRCRDPVRDRGARAVLREGQVAAGPGLRGEASDRREDGADRVAAVPRSRQGDGDAARRRRRRARGPWFGCRDRGGARRGQDAAPPRIPRGIEDPDRALPARRALRHRGAVSPAAGAACAASSDSPSPTASRPVLRPSRPSARWRRSWPVRAVARTGARRRDRADPARARPLPTSSSATGSPICSSWCSPPPACC